MKILLLGKNGQVGSELQQILPSLGQLIALSRAEADLEAPSGLDLILQQYAPDIIVNAAAYTAVDKAESDEATARKVNTEAVQKLASYAHAHNILLVHYSTDYVFDGEKPGAYTEQDQPNPQSVYGRTKLAGEEAILQSGCQALIFRTSWVFSVNGGNFIKTIMRLAQERESLNIVADQFGAPTSAKLIAELTGQAISAWENRTLDGGIYHLTASGAASWHEYATHIVKRMQAQGVLLKATPEQVLPIATEAYPVPAKRPKNSRLNTSSLRTALGVEIPDWTNHVDQVVDELIQHQAS